MGGDRKVAVRNLNVRESNTYINTLTLSQRYQTISFTKKLEDGDGCGDFSSFHNLLLSSWFWMLLLWKSQRKERGSNQFMGCQLLPQLHVLHIPTPSQTTLIMFDLKLSTQLRFAVVLHKYIYVIYIGFRLV